MIASLSVPRCFSTSFLAATFLFFAGCGEREGPSSWGGTVDALPGGGVVVHSPAAGIWDSSSVWQVEEELRIGTVEGRGPDVFTGISDLEIDALGRLYVLERFAHTVKVFDSMGAYVRNLGRKGGGPGEFGDPIGLSIGPRGQLWVSDPGNSRYSVYDTAGNYKTSYHRNVPGYSVPWPGKFSKTGVLYDLALRSGNENGPRRVLLGFRVAGGKLVSADTIPLPRDPFSAEDKQLVFRSGNSMMAISIPWAPDLVWWLDPGGYLWFGRSDRYRII